MTSLKLIRTTAFALAGLCFSGVAFAATPVSLKAQTVDADGNGKVTLGELFDNAGTSSGVVVAETQGHQVVLDAGRVQIAAQNAGLFWNNPNGLRRIIVGVSSGSVAAAPVAQPTGFAAPPSGPATASTSGTVVIRRGDLVNVTWRSQGISLRISGVAMRDAKLGERAEIQNPTSKKPIESIATGPGAAEAGPLAQLPSQSFASR